METFAVYWEPVIKTYGMIERKGLCLISLDLHLDRFRDEQGWLTPIASRFGSSLILIFSRPTSPSGLRLNLLLDRLPEKLAAAEKKEPEVRIDEPFHPKDFDSVCCHGACSGMRVDDAVELVYFQGPHYGDRYGIAAAAVTALAKHGVPLLGVVCTGASVYLVTPEGMATPARNALLEAFSVPETASRPSHP